MREHDVELPGEIMTERLVLRRYCLDDAPAYLDVCQRNREHLVPYEAGNPALQVATLEQSMALLRRFDEDWAARRAFFLGVWDRHHLHFVAQIYVGVSSRAPLPLVLEIGYFVDQEHEGKGYVAEATRNVVRVAFDELGADQVRIECNELNSRSRRVAERCGFRTAGLRPRTHPNLPMRDGTPSGDLIYSVTRSEWSRASSHRKA